MWLGCGRFRPIRRDSDSAESLSSASLAGSTHDVNVLPTKPPPRAAAAAAPNVAHAAAGATTRHRRLKPTWSSNGSASSYDNVDEPSTPPRHARMQPWLPHPRSSRTVHPAATKVAGSGTDEALDEAVQRLTPGEPSNVDVSTGNTSVWRRPTLDGHIQVIPPTMIGVFDPTSQLSKFAAQTSVRTTSPVANFQRQSVNTATASETANRKPTRYDGVRQADRVRNNRTFNAVNVHESLQRPLEQNCQPPETTKTTDSKLCSPCSEPSKLATSETPEVCETAREVTEPAEPTKPAESTEPPGDDGGHSVTSSSSSSSSSSSTDDDDDDDVEEENAERAEANADDEEVCEAVQSPVLESEQRQTPATPASGGRSSSDRSPGVVDVSDRKSEQAATSDERSAATSPVTPSRHENATDGDVVESPLPLPVSATSPSVYEASIHGSSDVDMEHLPDVEKEALSSSSSSESKSGVSSHDESDDNFVEQTELRISATDLGTFYITRILYT